jgi:hypothetical protein
MAQKLCQWKELDKRKHWQYSVLKRIESIPAVYDSQLATEYSKQLTES